MVGLRVFQLMNNGGDNAVDVRMLLCGQDAVRAAQGALIVTDLAGQPGIQA